MGPAEFEAAGLYDPAAPNAVDRLALLEWLVAHGATLDQMVRAQRETSLDGLGADLALYPPDGLTLAEVAARIDVTPERIEEIRFAAGLPPVDPDARIFTPEDAAGFATTAAGAALLGAEATRRFSRVAGSAVARLAEAAIVTFRVHVEGPIRKSHGSELALAQANWRGVQTLRVVPLALASIFHGHLLTAMRRLREARAGKSVDLVRMAVGFVDLVGFTPFSQHLEPHALAGVVERFEDTAYDATTARDGRVVKLIGDEVMFVARDPGAACEIALDLMERLCRDSHATPRGGLAWGDMLLRGGDYYGPTVNLAARLAEQAVPNELLVTPELVERARRPGLHFEPAGKRMLKGFDAPVRLMTVERAAAS